MNNMQRDPLQDMQLQQRYLKNRAKRVYRGSEDDGDVLSAVYTIAFYYFIAAVVYRLVKVWLLL